MQFTCETCCTRYVIPDERVAGKVLRIRCKRCRSIVEVTGSGGDLARDQPMFSTRGNLDPFQAVGGSGPWRLPTGGRVQLQRDVQVTVPNMVAAVPPPLPAAPESGAPGWHVAAKGRARGPLTLAQLEELAGQGGLHARTWVWRPGMATWLRLPQVEELAAVAAQAQEHKALLLEQDRAQMPAVPAAGWDAALPRAAGPFANLLSTHGDWIPSPAPAPVPTVVRKRAPLGTGWFALTPEAVERLLESPRLHVPGTGPWVTGVHLVQDRPRRLLATVAGLSACLLVGLGLLTLPLLMDLGPGQPVDLRAEVPSPVPELSAAECTPDAQEWQSIQSLAGPGPAAAPAPAPLRPRPVPKLESIARALGSTAARVLRAGSAP